MWCLLAVAVLLVQCGAHPYGPSEVAGGPDRMGWLDIFSPYIPPPEKRKTCSYKGSTYEEGSMVSTEEPCLKCRCLRGTLVCYLRVCPQLPDPPPSNCVLVLRKGACCSELICDDAGLSSNHIARSDTFAEFPLNVTSYKDGCISNGTLYASGSAMWTDRRCEYCYCIEGKERCVRPRCLSSPKGCIPRSNSHSCCPVRYDCERDTTLISSSTTSTTQSTVIEKNGLDCRVDGIIYPEGEKVSRVAKSPCDNCFCMRGMVRCVPLSCAPPLLGCTPIIHPGDCCASSYNCSKKISDVNISNDIETDRKFQGSIINERSFPGDTSLTPSQIADILLNGDGRNYRRIENKKNTSETNSDNNLDSNITTTETISTDVETSTGAEIIQSTTPFETTISTIGTTLSTEKVQLKSKLQNSSFTSTISPEIDNTTEEVTTVKILNETDVHINDIVHDKSKTLINDTINCTTEISALKNNNTDKVDNSLNKTNTYNDTEERILNQGLVEGIVISSEDINVNPKRRNMTNDFNLGSKFPSTQFIIPKDNDIFMVNVSTHVSTNNTVVTLKPVVSISPEIEALLNISMKKNSHKDDFYDYDYKSLLPPSLPNLEIIPFLAVDAVPKVDEIERESEKELDHFATAYPSPNDEKPYHTMFSTIPRDKYNATIYPYIPDSYNPTTFPPPYAEEKYIENPTNYPQLNLNNFNRNPTIYKQHINDKFKATTYNTILEEKYDPVQYGIDKFDATVYPSLTMGDIQTENPNFSFDGQTHNLFSPPLETEGGFLPRYPSSLDPYYSIGEDGSPITDSSLMITDHPKINTDDCISNGREFKNGELITEPNACVVCFCYYGNIHCQDPECPPVKANCKRIIDKDSKSCCGIEICNEPKEKSTEKSVETTHISQDIRINSVQPFKEIIKPEQASALDSLIGDILPFYSSSSTTRKIIELETTTTLPMISTSIKNESLLNQSTLNNHVDTVTLKQESNASDYLSSFYNHFIKQDETLPTFQNNSTESHIESPPSEAETDDDAFSFQNILKIFLGESEETTTKPPIVRTTQRYISTTTTYRTTQGFTTTTTTPIPITTTTTSKTTPVTVLPYKNYFKHEYAKINRTSNPVLYPNKNLTKLYKTSTHPPLIYSTINRPTKYKYPQTSSSMPPQIQITKKIPFSPLPMITEGPKLSLNRKPTTSSDSSMPFAAGLLKLAGCNIYGRMYRVGRIITELSGPCLECKCTEVGVQCNPLSC